jgi:hypothetical protein
VFVKFLAGLGMTRVFNALTLQRFNEYTKQREVPRHHRSGSARPVEDALEDVLRFSG